MFKTVFSAAVLTLAMTGASFAASLTGNFEGRSNHEVRGTVTIEKTDTGYIATLSNDFFLDGAPDPTLAFGTGDRADKSTIFTPLGKHSGGQSYAIPAGIDPSAFETFHVWCEQFSVPLGVAKLN